MDTAPEETVVIEVNASPALVQLHDLGYEDKAIAGQARVLLAALGEREHAPTRQGRTVPALPLQQHPIHTSVNHDKRPS